MTTLDKYQWTPDGKLRVAAAITATLAYNQRHGLRPSTVRQMARMANHKYHTSIQRYAAGNTNDPNRDHCKVLRDIAPFVYRVAGFELVPGARKIEKVVHVNIPSPERLDVAYWEGDELNVTYRNDWRSLVELGTEKGRKLEMPSIGLAADTRSPATLLWEKFLQLPEQLRSEVGAILSVPSTTMDALVGDAVVLNKNQINLVSEVIQDFLVRRTAQKPDVWDLARMAQSFPDASELHSLDVLQAIAADQVALTTINAVRLAKLMSDQGVPWSARELQERDSRSERQLTISETHPHAGGGQSDHGIERSDCHAP